jgi:hypothetical protein
MEGRQHTGQRAEILFCEYPDLKQAYSLTHSRRMIYNKKTHKDVIKKAEDL